MTDLIGKYVVIRSSPSGCWAGTLQNLDGNTATLVNARRLWRWWSAKGVSLSGVAAAGLHPDHINDCRIAVPVQTATVFEVCEIIEATADAKLSIENAKAIAR